MSEPLSIPIASEVTPDHRLADLTLSAAVTQLKLRRQQEFEFGRGDSDPIFFAEAQAISQHFIEHNSDTASMVSQLITQHKELFHK